MSAESPLLAPLKFKPLLQSKLWGGDGLYRILGKGGPGDKDMGEAWELSDNPHGPSVVDGGPFDGQPLRALYAARAAELLGPRFGSAPDSFPLLYKFIYARDKLSVQVHPGDGSPLGDAKTECWHIVDAPPGADIIVGLARRAPKGELLAALRGPDCASVLNRIPVRAGDTLFIPAGTVHAITEGLLIYEVQQNSDTTFRLYDWGRVEADGRPRKLHLEEAAQVIDFEVHGRHKIAPLARDAGGHREAFLVACKHFCLVALDGFRAPARLDLRGRFRVATALRGGFRLRGPGGAAELGRGETALLPGAMGWAEVEAREPDASLILSFVPEIEAEIMEPLRAAGHGDAAIRALGLDRMA